MKPRESYRVTVVRLVEFHNLGTTTVELPEGGHLFLLGDNGSGKTTLLDAIHLVLTAGREMEFNSAARVAGAKDSGGRTYQGVVLRYNAVTGRPARESGITYAALELKSSAGRVLSLAVGLSAEGMDVAIERWGGLAAVPVADLPLTVDEGGRLRAATAAEFKRGVSTLTGGHAYAHINDYADAVGDRLFGGTDKYADVCKLLRTGKAYREIAARAANYDELFRQLLEDPSRETFEPLLKGLRELEESKARQRVWREGGEIAVAERGTCAAADPSVLTPWLGNFLSFEESDVEAVRLVAAHLAATVGPQDADFLSVKTWSYRFRQGPLPSARPRLIGRKAREQEQARRLKASEDRLAEAEKALKGAERVLRDTEASAEAAKALVAALEEMRLAEVRAAQDVRLAESQVSDARTLAEQAENAAETRRREVAAAVEELEDVRLKMREAGVDGSLEKKIAGVERQIRTCEDAERKLHERRGGVVRKLETLAGQREAMKRMSESAAARCGELAKAMSVRLAGADIAEYVRSVCPEAVAANADFAALREKFVADAKVCEADIAFRIRDAKGEAYAFSFDVAANAIADRRGTSLAEVIADETRRLEELQGVIDRKSREVFERIFMGEVMRRLCIDLMQIEGLVGRIQRKLAGRRFGSNRYAFAVTPVPEYESFVGLVRKGHLLDASDGKDELRTYLEAHRDEIMNADIDAIPDMFDYRKWFRFQLKVMVENEEGRVIDRKVKSMGSGGEQAVPNYLLILTVAEFLYHGGESSDPPKAAPLLFDEAFYGIDAARRDQLLAFAEDLGLQLFVSSPDQDGVKREIRHSVSLIVVKDENLDVHLSPVTWNNAVVQTGLFGGESPALGMTVGEETR